LEENAKDSIHESVNAHSVVHDGELPRSMIEGAQRIEGGGPPQRGDVSGLPKPVKWFAYFVLTMMMGITVILWASNFLK
jgi:hypothetical protein